LSKLPWFVAPVASTNDIFTKYQAKSFPQYVLIDNTGIISSIPALGPLPNGDYETIDKVFFSITKRIQNEEREKEKSEIDSIFDK
jgi:thioredoxin-related protein